MSAGLPVRLLSSACFVIRLTFLFPTKKKKKATRAKLTELNRALDAEKRYRANFTTVLQRKEMYKGLHQRSEADLRAAREREHERECMFRNGVRRILGYADDMDRTVARFEIDVVISSASQGDQTDSGLLERGRDLRVNGIIDKYACGVESPGE